MASWLSRTFLAGAAAGAAGVTALNAVSYADMAVRGRGASSLPEESVEKLAAEAGVTIPGTGDERTHRVEALGALSGIATGVGVGVLTAVLGIRQLPLPAGAVLTGAAAMAGADVPMTRLGLTDPSQWSPVDWLSDVLPHLAYGLATAWTLRAAAKWA